MKQILEELQSLRKEVSESNRTSAYGTRFVNDFFEAINNLSKGMPSTKSNNNWAYKDVSFADKRSNTFVFRIKFLKRMTSFDKQVMLAVTSDTMTKINGTILTPKDEQEEQLLISTTIMCRAILTLGDI